MSKDALDERVTVRLPGPLLQGLQAAAETDSRSLASAIRKILIDHEAAARRLQQEAERQ